MLDLDYHMHAHDVIRDRLEDRSPWTWPRHENDAIAECLAALDTIGPFPRDLAHEDRGYALAEAFEEALTCALADRLAEAEDALQWALDGDDAEEAESAMEVLDDLRDLENDATHISVDELADALAAHERVRNA